jgi:hypothetical protein
VTDEPLNSKIPWDDEDFASSSPDIVIDSITTTEIETSNDFEEDLFKYMPKVRALIDTGEDVELTIGAMADYVGVTVTRFKRLYGAAKKEMAIQTEMRFGPDLRITMIGDADGEIKRIKDELESLQRDRAAALEMADEAKADPELAKGMPRRMLQLAAMAEKDYFRAINDLSATLHKWQDRKAKLAGVEVQRKEVIHANATALLKQLYNFEAEQHRRSVVEDGTLLSPAFTVPLDEPPLPNLK